MNARTQAGNAGEAPATTNQAAAAPAPATKAKKADKSEGAKHVPAFAPAVAKADRYQGHGGRFVIVDGQRVPADDEGNPLPLDGDGNVIEPKAQA
jgi:hypothetical protein